MEESPLDFRADKARKGKRPYVFSYGKARKCDHPRLEIVARGTSFYRCCECNYGFWLPTATMWPLHWTPIMGAFWIFKFAKEFGVKALDQVLRTPIGTVDQTEHKAVLPDGKSFRDLLNEYDNADVTALFEGENGARDLLGLESGEYTDGHDAGEKARSGGED